MPSEASCGEWRDLAPEAFADGAPCPVEIVAGFQG
jgi:hypothetical protein